MRLGTSGAVTSSAERNSFAGWDGSAAGPVWPVAAPTLHVSTSNNAPADLQASLTPRFAMGLPIMPELLLELGRRLVPRAATGVCDCVGRRPGRHANALLVWFHGQGLFG